MKKRILSILLALALLCAILPAAAIRATAATSGTCGDNLTWSYDSATGTLTIQGSGKMDDFDYFDPAPWDELTDSIKKITIGNSVTSIGYSAFDGCTSLTSVTIGSGVTSIGAVAFYECNSLSNVTIPNSVTNIGNNAFAGCSSLTSVTIPSGVTSIGDGTFHSCTSLTSVVIGSSVTSIGSYTFMDCTSLTSVTISDSVTSIDDYAFLGCGSLTSVTIPDSVTSIGDSAFEQCDLLTIYGVAGSYAETYANEFGIPFVAIGEKSPVLWIVLGIVGVLLIGLAVWLLLRRRRAASGPRVRKSAPAKTASPGLTPNAPAQTNPSKQTDCFCGNCGARVESGFGFCPNCGGKL